MIKTKTLFTKLFLSYSMIIFLSFTLFGLVFIYIFHLNLYDDYEELYDFHYERLQEQIAQSAEEGWSDEETADLIQPSLHHRNYNIFIYDNTGELFIQPEGDAEYEPDQEIILTASDEFVSEGATMNGNLSYIIADSFSVPGNEETYVAVMVFHDLNHQYQQMALMVLIPFIITIAFSGGIIYFISQKITAPLRHMNEAALQLATGDFSRRVTVSSRDEIGQLGDTFNYMAEELNSLEKMRKEFIANVSHDLRSPLTSMKGFIVALLDGTIPENKRDHYYLLMKEETERVIQLVNDTLDMSRLEAGQIEIAPAPYNLTRQLQRIAVLLEPQLERKGVGIQLEPEDTDLFVVADKDRIEQALVNLLHNALQFSLNGETIRIQLETTGDMLAVHVQDEGKGIPEAQLKHIWERFYKGEKSRTGKGGTGIGLSIVKSIMELHKTEITVKSKLGQGTVFTFQLPLKK
ncbi:sensor histidine kinase [Alkalicoccus daliensis]|uniref:histidine kinase n=1 Tax=Alkalicoccus daliensis TaxID=745820 RepID=A0A1H0HDD6_9BACI|nr:HAMP domain-containing sensor histidine kinase [Alkalicoccus daliensis]SDO17093.1 Signal transduction histidine kinase [Alkalicoccus daliensis]